MSAHLVVAGYYGCGNLGDDAILLGFLNGLQRSHADVTVLSGDPEMTTRMYGVRSIARKDLATFKQTMSSASMLVFAGGSIFQDVTSVRSVAYYSQLVRTAKSLGKPCIMVGQGIGPLNTFVGKRLAKAAFNSCRTILVRDPVSVATLKSLGVKCPIETAADLAFMLPKPAASSSVESYGVGGMPAVGLAPRPFGKGNDVVQLFAAIIRKLYENKLMPVLVELDHKHDGPLIAAIDQACGGKVPSIKNLNTPMVLQERLARMEGMIAMRLHAGILAATVGVAPTMVSYDPKVNAFAQLLNLPRAIDVNKASPDAIVQGFLTMNRDRATWNAKVTQSVEALRTEAAKNVDAILKHLPNSEKVGSA